MRIVWKTSWLKLSNCVTQHCVQWMQHKDTTKTQHPLNTAAAAGESLQTWNVNLRWMLQMIHIIFHSLLHLKRMNKLPLKVQTDVTGCVFGTEQLFMQIFHRNDPKFHSEAKKKPDPKTNPKDNPSLHKPENWSPHKTNPEINQSMNQCCPVPINQRRLTAREARNIEKTERNKGNQGEIQNAEGQRSSSSD